MSTNRQRVLVVDDEPMDLTISARLLAEEAFDVVTANTLDEAWAAMRTAEPNLIIMDLRLGNERGEDLLELVRVKYPAIRRLVLTGSSSDRIEALAAAKIADAIVEKSAPSTALIEAVHAALRAERTSS